MPLFLLFVDLTLFSAKQLSNDTPLCWPTDLGGLDLIN